MSVSKFSKTRKFNVEEVLNGYKNNKCRLCEELFCCPECRLKHEENAHKINVECTLCIYGFVIVKKLNLPDLVEHVISSHLLPISRCVYCERQISADTIRNHNNSDCTFTNFTDKEITNCWSKLPPEIREEYMNPCNINNQVEDGNVNIAVSVVLQKDAVELDSPVLGGLQPQQLFETGEFANSTPVLETAQKSENNDDQIKKIESPANDRNLILKKSEDKVHAFEDSNKTRKVQFDITPQPATSKSSVSFHGLIKKSSIKKNDLKTGGEKIGADMQPVECYKTDQQQNILCAQEVQSIQAVNKSLGQDKQSCTDRVTIPVKPMIRDLNKSAIVENSTDTIFDDTDASHWLTAIADLPENNSEHSSSSGMFTTCYIDTTSDNHAQENYLQREPEIIVSLHSTTKQENETDVKKDVDVKSAWTDMWIKCKSKVVEFTRISMKRSRSELEMSSDKEENVTPLHEVKRRRLSIRARRPIHYYIKPEVKRDVKKINRGMQTTI